MSVVDDIMVCVACVVDDNDAAVVHVESERSPLIPPNLLPSFPVLPPVVYAVDDDDCAVVGMLQCLIDEWQGVVVECQGEHVVLTVYCVCCLQAGYPCAYAVEVMSMSDTLSGCRQLAMRKQSLHTLRVLRSMSGSCSFSVS